MNKLLNWLSGIFSRKPRWNGTPEMFLALVIEFQTRNDKKVSAIEVLKCGEVLQRVMHVDLHPFKDFGDLLRHGKPDHSIVLQLLSKTDEMHRRIELKKAIYGENANLGEDDVLKSNAEGAVFARKFIEDLSQHVHFHEDDQQLINKWKKP